MVVSQNDGKEKSAIKAKKRKKERGSKKKIRLSEQEKSAIKAKEAEKRAQKQEKLRLRKKQKRKTVLKAMIPELTKPILAAFVVFILISQIFQFADLDNSYVTTGECVEIRWVSVGQAPPYVILKLEDGSEYYARGLSQNGPITPYSELCEGNTYIIRYDNKWPYFDAKRILAMEDDEGNVFNTVERFNARQRLRKRGCWCLFAGYAIIFLVVKWVLIYDRTAPRDV